MQINVELSSVKNTDVKQLKEDMVTKAGDQEFQVLLRRFNKFSDVENIWNFQNVYLPRMKKFFDSVEALHESNAQMRECIIDFDQKLSLKLNKSQLITLKQEVGGNYLPHEYKNEVADRFARLEKLLDQNINTVQTVADECRDKVEELEADTIEF